ncbi:MAG TPA: Spy/CpxP family protein refolding chaperone [Steroidobacteraceae bacterium]|nr:Spy/CpxP family protein refolding chaperone [Steroidobacteraceae bacterium]
MNARRHVLTVGLIATTAIALAAAPAVARAAAGPAATASAVPAAAAAGPAGCGACAPAGGQWGGRARHSRWRRPHRSRGGEHRPGPWFLMRALDLGAVQRQSVRAIFRDGHAGLRELHAKMRSNERRLRESLPGDPNHAALVATLSRENGALFARSIVEREAMRAKFYAVLTPAQKAKLAQFKAGKAAARMRGCGGGRFNRRRP